MTKNTTDIFSEKHFADVYTVPSIYICKDYKNCRRQNCRFFHRYKVPKFIDTQVHPLAVPYPLSNEIRSGYKVPLALVCSDWVNGKCRHTNARDCQYIHAFCTQERPFCPNIRFCRDIECWFAHMEFDVEGAETEAQIKRNSLLKSDSPAAKKELTLKDISDQETEEGECKTSDESPQHHLPSKQESGNVNLNATLDTHRDAKEISANQRITSELECRGDRKTAMTPQRHNDSRSRKDSRENEFLLDDKKGVKLAPIPSVAEQRRPGDHPPPNSFVRSKELQRIEEEISNASKLQKLKKELLEEQVGMKNSLPQSSENGAAQFESTANPFPNPQFTFPSTSQPQYVYGNMAGYPQIGMMPPHLVPLPFQYPAAPLLQQNRSYYCSIMTPNGPQWATLTIHNDPPEPTKKPDMIPRVPNQSFMQSASQYTKKRKRKLEQDLITFDSSDQE